MAIFASRNYGWAEQDVSARLDYSEDWSDFVSADDAIVNSVWQADSPDVTLADPMIVGEVTTVWVSGGVVGKTYRISNTITTSAGRRDVRYFVLSITDGAAPDKPITSALFNRFKAVRDFKTNSLSFLDKSFPVDQISDDDIWDSLLVAEATASRELRVFLEPTVVIPEDAKQAEIDALVAAGTKFVTEAPYDYDPQGWNSNSWGYMLLRKTPVVRVDSVHFTYPNPSSDVLNVPHEWLRLDRKYGHLRFVPTGTMMALGPMSTYIMTAISSGRVIPGMIHVRYVAGLENAAQTYPDLVSVVKRMAIMRILKSAFLPQSSSISADGLSQSTSIDADKWQDAIDHDLATLRDAIHGVRFGVL